MGPLHNIHRPMLAEASLALDSRLLGREGAQRQGVEIWRCWVLKGEAAVHVFYMCVAVRPETVIPKATGWAKEREEVRL